MVASRNSAPLLGRTEPRLFTAPLVTGPAGPCGCGCALTPATSKGFEATKFAQDVVGMRLFPWQRWFLIHALELLPTGGFRFRTVLLMVARQNGKTSLVEIKNLWKAFMLGVPLIIGTAQNLDIAEESWDKALEIIEGTEDLAAELDQVSKVNGKKFFKLNNGSRWKVTTANRRGGRGLAGDDVNLDELREHQKWDAWGAVTKTTMAKAGAQVYAFSNAGDDSSIVLNKLQERGRSAAGTPVEELLAADVLDDESDGMAVDVTLGHFEYSAPDDTKCTCARQKDAPHKRTCDIVRPDILAMANPSMGHHGGVLHTALISAANTDPDPIFLTECLCVRVPDLSGQAIDPSVWKELGDPHSKRDSWAVVSVDISPDRAYTVVALYAHDIDGTGHLRIAIHQEGTAGIVRYLGEVRTALGDNLLAVGMGRGTYASLKTELKDAGFALPEDADFPLPGDLAVLTGPDIAAATGQMIDAVRYKRLRHVPSKALDDAVKTSKTRQVGDTVTWASTDRETDSTPLRGATIARWTYYSRLGTMQADGYDPTEDIL